VVKHRNLDPGIKGSNPFFPDCVPLSFCDICDKCQCQLASSLKQFVIVIDLKGAASNQSIKDWSSTLPYYDIMILRKFYNLLLISYLLTGLRLLFEKHLALCCVGHLSNYKSIE
jgi:hypothetical protein